MVVKFWMLRPGSARQAAKAEYETAHPLTPARATPAKAVRPKRGQIALIERDGQQGYIGQRGGFHAFSTGPERAIAIRLATRCCPAIPPCLRVVDGLYAVGTFTGRRYALLDGTPRLLRQSVKVAEGNELLAWRDNETENPCADSRGQSEAT